MACARCDKVFAPLREAQERRKAEGLPPAQICFGCLRPIPHYPGMYGAGFESRTVDHEHLEACEGRNVWAPVMFELCLTCFRADQRKNGEAPLFDPPFHDLEIPDPPPQAAQVAEPPPKVELTPRERLEAMLQTQGMADLLRGLLEAAEAKR